LRDLTKVEEIPMYEYLTLLLRPLSKLKSSLHRVRTSFEALPGFPLAIAEIYCWKLAQESRKPLKAVAYPIYM
jgi:hypothetical protein